MTTHPHRYHLVADAAGAAWVRGVFRQLGDGGDAELLNCRTAVLPSGFAASFAITEAQRVVLEAVEDAGQVPAGVRFTRSDATTGEVKYTNHLPARAALGLRLLTPADALAVLNASLPNAEPTQPR